MRGRSARRGVAVFMILLMLALTMSLSYAAMRTQFTATRIQQNAGRQASARQAAVTGASMALKRMQTTNWGGLGSTFHRALGTYESFDATYTFGDDSLTMASTDYADYPYRATISVVGTATDPDSPQCVSTYRIRIVVRLDPNKLAAEPSDWASMQQYTYYQTYKEDNSLDIPCRIQGAVRSQGKLTFAVNYPTDSSAWWRYLIDLNTMRSNGQSDYRPFTGPVHLKIIDQDSKSYTGLLLLGLTVTDTSVKEAAADWVLPQSLTTYQTYPGSPAYTIPSLPSVLENTQLRPDTETNPMGIFFRSGSLTIRGGVTIQGSLFCTNDVTISGSGVQLKSLDLPSLHNTTVPIRLPVLACDRLTIKSTAVATVAGLVATFNEFLINQGLETMTFPVTGRVVARRLTFEERLPWNSLDWESLYTSWVIQLFFPGRIFYFPQWLGTQGRTIQPRLTVVPDTGSVTYHWFNGQQPVYAPPADDAAMHWQVLSWTETP